MEKKTDPNNITKDTLRKLDPQITAAIITAVATIATAIIGAYFLRDLKKPTPDEDTGQLGQVSDSTPQVEEDDAEPAMSTVPPTESASRVGEIVDTPSPPTSVSPTAGAISVEYTEGDEVLFEDDFEEGNGSRWVVDWGEWQVVEEEGGNGNLVYYSEVGETYLPMSRNWTNFAVEMRIKVLSWSATNQNAIFLKLRRSQTGCPNYMLHIYRGSAEFWRAGVSCEDNVILDAYFFAPSMLPANQWLVIRAELFEDRIVTEVDGIRTNDVRDSELTNGTIALMNWERSHVYVDDVRVVELIPR